MNEKKLKQVEKLKENFAKAKAIVFADYHGLSAAQINDLRTTLKEQGGDASVAKNTLIKLAIENNDENLTEVLTGPTMTIFSYTDAVAGVKAVFDFAKENELPNIKAGLIDGNFAAYSKLEVLSTLPGKDELIVKVIQRMNSPISGLVNTLGGVQRSFVYALSAISEKKL